MKRRRYGRLRWTGCWKSIAGSSMSAVLPIWLELWLSENQMLAGKLRGRKKFWIFVLIFLPNNFLASSTHSSLCSGPIMVINGWGFYINESAVNDSALSNCIGFIYAASSVPLDTGSEWWTEGRIWLGWNGGDNGRIIDGRIIFLKKRSEKILSRRKMLRQRLVARRPSYNGLISRLIVLNSLWSSVQSILCWRPCESEKSVVINSFYIFSSSDQSTIINHQWIIFRVAWIGWGATLVSERRAGPQVVMLTAVQSFSAGGTATLFHPERWWRRDN